MNPAPLTWKRIRGGYYEAKASVTVRRTERKIYERRSATFYVRHIPEWTGPQKWAVTADGFQGEQFIVLTDAIFHTMREAMEGAAIAAAGGFAAYLSGYCADISK